MDRVNPSNAITAIRLLSVPFMVRALLAGRFGLACLLFWLAVVTDVVDGRLARARGETTHFGGLLDHASDACFVVASLAALAAGGRLTWLLPIVVAIAFAQYVLDSRWLAGFPLRASRIGRWNGILYFVPVGIVVSREALGWVEPADHVVAALAWALVASTLISIADRAVGLVRVRSRNE